MSKKSLWEKIHPLFFCVGARLWLEAAAPLPLFSFKSSQRYRKGASASLELYSVHTHTEVTFFTSSLLFCEAVWPRLPVFFCMTPGGHGKKKGGMGRRRKEGSL